MTCGANRRPIPAASPRSKAGTCSTPTFAYHSKGGRWSLGIYGKNVTDERYDNARLNTGDYVLVMLSNDVSEFGVRYTTRF